MNNLIRVEDAKLYLAKNYIDGNKSLGQCLDEVPTVNAIVIPDETTNGDMIKAMFPNIEMWGESKNTLDYSLGGMIHRVLKSWWNAPYKKGEVK